LFAARKENNAMQTTTTRLQPLLAAAAVSLIVLSGVGVAAMTGMIPVTKSQDSALEVPKEMVNPIAPAISHPIPVAPAKPKPVVRKAAPAPAGQFATVESVREVKEPGDAKGLGAFAGHQVEKQVRAEKRWEIALRLDDGSQRTLPSAVEPAWRAGDRVRIVDDKLQAI
jgi:hypothetical protein